MSHGLPVLQYLSMMERSCSSPSRQVRALLPAPGQEQSLEVAQSYRGPGAGEAVQGQEQKGGCGAGQEAVSFCVTRALHHAQLAWARCAAGSRAEAAGAQHRDQPRERSAAGSRCRSVPPRSPRAAPCWRPQLSTGWRAWCQVRTKMVQHKNAADRGTGVSCAPRAPPVRPPPACATTPSPGTPLEHPTAGSVARRGLGHMLQVAAGAWAAPGPPRRRGAWWAGGLGALPAQPAPYAHLGPPRSSGSPCSRVLSAPLLRVATPSAAAPHSPWQVWGSG